jgi:hypothetical protein
MARPAAAPQIDHARPSRQTARYSDRTMLDDVAAQRVRRPRHTVALALRHLVQRQRARHRAGPGVRSGKVEWRGSVAYLLLGPTILIGAPALAGTTWARARLFYPDAAWRLFAFRVPGSLSR